MTTKTYKMNNPNIIKLRELGFHFLPTRSSSEDRIYIYTCPLLKFKATPLLECNIFVEVNSGDVTFNVYTQEGHPYAPFYNQDSNNDVVEMINKKLKNKFRKFGIRKAK